MSVDPSIRDHQTWIGYLQPDGLVVSPAALVDAQVLVNKNAAPLQQRWAEFVTEVKDDDKTIPVVGSTVEVLRGFLGWPDDCLVGLSTDRPIPESLKVPLREFGETLEPTYAFEPPQPDDADNPWLLLVQDLPRGAHLDTPCDSTLSGWTATPTRRFERLLRETGVAIGLLSNRTHFRLVYAPRGENTGTITFPVDAMSEVAGRPIVAAFEMLLSRERLLSAPREVRLPALLKRSRDYQVRVSTALAQQVLDALYELLRGFQAANERAHGELLRKELEEHPDAIYSGLLTVLMRLVFLLYAEDRGLMPGSDLYVRNYAIHGLFERLRADAEQNPDTMDHRYGAWAQFLALCRAIFSGCDHALMKMPARKGHLFDPDRFPFLEGRGLPDNRLPLVSDGTMERILRKLLLLDGERLSYRTLDVEQIGSVYETMMGFKLRLADGATIALKPAKARGAPSPVNLEQLLATKAADRSKYIRELTDNKLTAAAATAVKEAESIDDLLAALEKRIARNATPQPVAKGAMVLQPSDERRRSGSHYTPRSLTEPIVRKTLEPIHKRLGERPTPEQLLDLKICDPAMGSGAFLVEACRQLGDELVKAWHVHNCVPKIPPDEDELLHARRVIAQRCLYGVDKNPMAVDLAKLSLWLATLAKDHPFTFLDHALRAGDSLVGLTRQQIADFHWQRTTERRLGQEHVAERIERATMARKEILDAGDTLRPEEKAQRLAVADEALDAVRFFGDLCVAAFFAGDKDKTRKSTRNDYLDALTEYLRSGDPRKRPTREVRALRGGDRPVDPFHWEIEFPEVFARRDAGFDAIIGNPPFAGRTTLSEGSAEHYIDWLQSLHEESHGNADLVAHFFRRVFGILRPAACSGLIATNTIAQGDTRATGLRWICMHGGTIYAARKRYRWPGEAAVMVSVVHVLKDALPGPFDLDGQLVPSITAYLFHAGGHENPQPLRTNEGKSFQGSVVVGMGFTFDDTDASGVASPVSVMRELIAKRPANGSAIFPYIGGEEINEDPQHRPHRYVINFDEAGETEARAKWPDLMKIVEARVKPERTRRGNSWSADKQKRAERWWLFARTAKDLYATVRPLKRALVCAQTSKYIAFAFLPTNIVFSHYTIVFAFDHYAGSAALHSGAHGLWISFFGSTLEDRQRYIPTDCFGTFPFPERFETNPRLEATGKAFYEFRAAAMVRNDEGLTKTYNRFHDPNETSPDIAQLRELHAAMDRAVLDAYGWTDIPTDCQFLLDYENDEDEDDEGFSLAAGGSVRKVRTRKKPWRYRWPDEIRDEVLARLLALNAERAAEERRAGLAAEAAGKRKTKTTKRAGKKVAAATPGLFGADSELAPTFAPVPMLEAVELMVAILDELRPARVQQIAAERIFILAVNEQARDLYTRGGAAAGTDAAQPNPSFVALWKSVAAMNYATLSGSGMVTRTSQSITFTKPEHAEMAKAAVAQFREGEAIKRAWPVEVDNVQYVVP